MTNIELMISAISSGRADDATVSAALDALMGDGGYSMIEAVVSVARARIHYEEARDIATAAKLLRPGAPFRPLLLNVIVIECPHADEDADAAITVLSGDVWPYLAAGNRWPVAGGHTLQQIGVGARWVIGRAETIAKNTGMKSRILSKHRSK